MDTWLVYLGVFLLLTCVIVSSISLFNREVDVKRVVTFATIGLFSGVILILGERITTIRIPILGEIVAKAHQDAKEIEQTRQEVVEQQKIVTQVVDQARSLQNEINALKIALKYQRIGARKKYLQEKIDELSQEKYELNNKYAQSLAEGTALSVPQFGPPEYFRIEQKLIKLGGILDGYYKELDELKAEESEVNHME